MSIPRILSLLLSALLPLMAQTVSPDPANPGPKEIALDNLLSERGSPKTLDEMISAAKKAGVSAQAILEARFLYHVDRREDEAIAAMLPEFKEQDKAFKIEDSAIFVVKEDWLAVIEYVQAIASLKQGDKTAFKTHITEAFWLSPRQAAAFAPHIDRMRLEETMRAVKIDFASKLTSALGGDDIPLQSLMKGKKAMIIHFWSPASEESEASLPDYAITAKTLSEKGIAMVSLLPEGTPDILTKARAAIKTLGDKPPGAWLIDRKEQPMTRELRVQTLPVFALVSSDGRVLFNGDPSDDALWEALQKIDDAITRPEAPESE